ncbi:hypothetical protein HDU98_005630 [Podochytrium sp. JEL0797]|nr:hypothetical protein HDU98_005630 [Podochytrium sp. JEL0797]
MDKSPTGLRVRTPYERPAQSLAPLSAHDDQKNDRMHLDADLDAAPKNPRARVYVGNLAYEVGWQDLKDYMRKCGEVIFADVLTMPGGRSKGCGVVEYATAEEADRAIRELNDTPLWADKFLCLPYIVSWQDMKDLFRQAGKVVRGPRSALQRNRDPEAAVVVTETSAGVPIWTEDPGDPIVVALGAADQGTEPESVVKVGVVDTEDLLDGMIDMTKVADTEDQRRMTEVGMVGREEVLLTTKIAGETTRKNAPKKPVTGNAPGTRFQDAISEPPTGLDDSTRVYGLRSKAPSTSTSTTSSASAAAAPLSAQHGGEAVLNAPSATLATQQRSTLIYDSVSFALATMNDRLDRNTDSIDLDSRLIQQFDLINPKPPKFPRLSRN